MTTTTLPATLVPAAASTRPGASPAIPKRTLVRAFVDRRWALVPPILIAASILFGATTVRLALRDHGTAAERDYYRKAAEWDAHRAARAAAERLRWTISPSLRLDPRGVVEIELAIMDKYGIPIDGAEVALEAIPVRAADLAATRSAVERRPGVYAAEFPVLASGQWEFRAVIERRGERVEERFRRIVSRPPMAASGARR